MSGKAEQLEKGWSRNCLTQGEKKFKKKIQKRKHRREAKKIGSPNPQSNRYKGWSL